MAPTTVGHGTDSVRRCKKCGKYLFDFENDHICPKLCGQCIFLGMMPVEYGYALYCFEHEVYLEGRDDHSAEICEACEKERTNEADQI